MAGLDREASKSPNGTASRKSGPTPRSAFVRPHRPALAGTGPPCTMQWDGALPSPKRRSCLRRNGWGSQSSPRNSCVARPGGDGSHSSRGKSRAIGYRARWPHESFTKPWAEDRQTALSRRFVCATPNPVRIILANRTIFHIAMVSKPAGGRSRPPRRSWMVP